MLLLSVLACGPADQVVWDSTTAADGLADVTVAMFTLGLAQDEDSALLDVPNAAGTSLDLLIRDRGGRPVTGWTVDTLNPDVAQAVVPAGELVEDDLPVTVHFRGEGSTDLFVIDANGAVVDWQPIEVRQPRGAELFAYEALAVDVRAPLEQVDVLPGSLGTVAVSWVDLSGDPLVGTGLLDADTPDDALTVGNNDALEGRAFEAFDLAVADDAAPGDRTVALTANGEAVRDVTVRVHDTASVTAVRLDVAVDTDDEGASGNVRAVVLADEVELFGVPVEWRDGGEAVGVGSWVQISGNPGESRTLEACYGERCGTVDVPGHVVSVGSPLATAPLVDCGGCATSGGGPTAGALVALLAIFRRRRR